MACAARSRKIIGIWEETVEMNTCLCLSDQERQGVQGLMNQTWGGPAAGYVEGDPELQLEGREIGGMDSESKQGHSYIDED